MPFKLGDWIRHPTFRPGQVTADPETHYVIRFVKVGEKRLHKTFVTEAGEPPSPDFKFPELGKAKKLSSTASRTKSRAVAFSFDHLLERLLGVYPAGFEDPSFENDERSYKQAAVSKFHEALNEQALHQLIEGGNFEEISNRAKHMASAKMNLIFPQELMSLNDALKTPEGQQAFSLSLFDVLYGKDEKSARFERYVATLDKIGCLKWTIATYFQFLATRGADMFMKPTVSQALADAVGVDLKYATVPNWQTCRLLEDVTE